MLILPGVFLLLSSYFIRKFTMEKIKLTIACAALNCAIHNEEAVSRYENALTRQNLARKECFRGYTVKPHSPAKSHMSTYIRYGAK